MATLNLGRIKPVFRGAYNNSTAYVVDDIVTSGGSSYICIQASTGNAVSNATYWTQMAAGGTDVGTTLTTQGDILYRDGSGLQRLGAGTSGQVLQTGGTGANPSWGTVSSDFVHITTIDVSNASSAELVHGSNNVVFDGTYERYHLKVMNYYANGTPSELQFRITLDGGTSYKTSGYYTNRWRSYFSATANETSNLTDAIARFHFGPVQASNQSFSFGDFWFSKPTLNHYPDVRGFFWGAENNQALIGMSGGRYETSTTAWNGFKVEQQGGGNFSAKLAWYGIKA